MWIQKRVRTDANGKEYVRWKARYRGPDGREYSKSFPRESEARAWVDDQKHLIRTDGWVAPEEAETLAKVTVEELAAEWQTKRRKKKHSTLVRQDIALRKHIIPTMGDLTVKSLRYGDILDFISELEESGLAPATISKSLQILSNVIDYGIRQNYTRQNPCTLLTKEERPGSRAQREIIFLTPQQVGDLSEAINPRYRAMVLLAAYRGLRFGEITGLKTSRLNLLARKVEVKEILSEVGGRLYFETPKTEESVRTLSMPPFLVAELDRHLTENPPKADLVFTNPDGSLIRRSNFARRIWAPARAAAGLDPALTFHGLRHTAVSLLISRQAQLVEIGAIMGWSKNSLAKMAARYGHLYEDREQHLTDELELVHRAVAAPVRP